MSNDITTYPRRGAQQPGSAFTTSSRGVDCTPEKLPGEDRIVTAVEDAGVPKRESNPHP